MPVKSLCDSNIWPQVRHFLTSGRPIPSPMSGSDHFRTTHFPLHSSTLPDLSNNPHSYYLARRLIQPSPLCAYNIPQCDSEIVPMKGFFASKFMQIRSGHGPALWSPVDPGTQLFTSPTESSLGDQCTVQMTTFMDVSTVSNKTVPITNPNTVREAHCNHMWEFRLALVWPNKVQTLGYKPVLGSCDLAQRRWRYIHFKSPMSLEQFCC